jgi:pleuromutilin/lincosamide/streptogramin A transport system ATP-binding/permease protein
MLQITNLKLEIEGKALLEIEHLQAMHGETIGLIGENGSGKSTLLHYIKDHETLLTDKEIKLIPQIKENDLKKSGGETTKIYLQDMLNTQAGILLLDEPTTHLDETNSEWLMKELQHLSAIKIIVSHDREFLDQITDKIWSIEDESITVYPGNYSKYKQIKDHQLKRQQNEYEKYKKEKAHLEQAAENKSRQADRANRVYDSHSGKYVTHETPYFNKMQKRLHKVRKGIESRINQLEEKEKPFEDKKIMFHSQSIESLGKKTIIRIEHEDVPANEKTLLKDVAFYIKSTEKVAITGSNGSGKTTFLNFLYHKYQYSNLKIGYFYQNLESLDMDKTIIENIMGTSHYDETTVRTVLARLNIKREDVYKQVQVTSGGERVKIQLVKMLMADHQVLLLDEPTNFLDIHTIEALEEMLIAYPGTLILVSHDKRFRENIVSRTFNIENAKLVEDIEITDEDATEQSLMLIDNKISEVLGRLSIAPSEELEKEFDRLLKEKQKLKK